MSRARLAKVPAPALCGLALLALACGDPDEPRAGGRPLSHWVSEARESSFLPWLNSRDDERRREAFDRLLEIGEPAVPALITLLDGGRATRSDAMSALCRLGPRAAAAAPELRRRADAGDRAADYTLECIERGADGLRERRQRERREREEARRRPPEPTR